MDVDTTLTLIFICLPIVFALICLLTAFNFLKFAYNLEDLPTSKIRSAAQGYVELQGHTQSLLAEGTYTKFSRQPCAWYSYTIEELITLQREGQSTSVWQPFERGTSSDPFLVVDDTGECAILPLEANIIPTQNLWWRGHTRTPAPPSTSFWGRLWCRSWGRYRYSEYFLPLGVHISATGTFYTVKQQDPLLQSNPALQRYSTEKGLNTINLLTSQHLAKNEQCLVCNVPHSHLIRQYKFKAFIFFIAFLFFISLSAHSSYPIVKKTLSTWRLSSY